MSEIEKYYNGEIHVDFDKETIKITQPMFEPGELESFDNYIHSIVEDYSKMKLHEKDQILTQRIIMKQEEEIERLNNLLKETSQTLSEQTIKAITLKSENKRLNNIINKIIADIEDVRDKNNYYDDYNIDSSILTYWIDILKGSDKE